MKLITFATILFLFAFQAEAQRYITKTGRITFFSDGPLEKIEAVNNGVNSALDSQSGMFVFKVLIKSFVFEKALMQEHFNENYMESDKYPLATFKGKVKNIKDIHFTKPGSYDAEVEGGDVLGKSSFTIKLADYNIKIPSIVEGKIAEEIFITTTINLKPLKK